MTRPGRLSAGIILTVLLLTMFGAGWLVGVTGFGSTVDPATLPERERQFAERMKDVALVGVFTIEGRADQTPEADRYDISSIEKVGEDRWRFNMRMRHGTTDVTLPVTVPMRWIDDTPMVLLTDLSIPALGTFTARVFFYDGRYAGTWQHGSTVGGHMYGRIEPSAGR